MLLLKRDCIACRCFIFLLSGATFIQQAAADDTPCLVPKEPASGRYVKTAQGYMVPYTETSSAGVTFDMVPIPGGKFKLGSPETEKGRDADEGPQVEVEIEPFWMGKHEVTITEYQVYMDLTDQLRKPNETTATKITEKNKVDAITVPSELYDPSFLYKSIKWDPRWPVVTIKQFAARQYTKWLSKTTGTIYRLPNEAEWEYACRAGTTTAYHFGDDPKQLADYAWLEENSKLKNDDGEEELTIHRVGLKKPNPWGLRDMYGNAMEWTLDAYEPRRYQQLADSKTKQVGLALTNWPAKTFPRVLRGGSIFSAADRTRSASRIPSDDKKWSEYDPNSPNSPWWFTTEPATAVGLRIIRPLVAPTKEELTKCWEVDNADSKEAVDTHIREGYGGYGVVIPKEKQKQSPAKNEK